MSIGTLAEMGRRRVGVVGALVLAVACGACAEGSEGSSPTDVAIGVPEGERARVERIVDGDTLVMSDDRRVRLTGIDTPETVDPRRPVQCFGKAASQELERLLPEGTGVVLVYDVDRFDRYGRTLAYVYRASDALFVNRSLVRNGFARAYTVPPNVAHADDFVAREREARERNAGLWAACA
jgi:micrococcal nuclease